MCTPGSMHYLWLYSKTAAKLQMAACVTREAAPSAGLPSSADSRDPFVEGSSRGLEITAET